MKTVALIKPVAMVLGGELPICVWGARKDDHAKGEWFHIPSWRVEFADDLMTPYDWRVHKSLGPTNAWVLAEATTGYAAQAGFDDDESMDDVIDLFCSMKLPKLTAEKIAEAIKKAHTFIDTLPPRPAHLPAV